MTNEPTTLTVPAQPLSAEAFAPFGVYGGEPGRTPDWMASGWRVGGGVREDRQEHGPRVADLWNIGDLSYEGDVPYLGFVRYYNQGFRVSQLERHPGETQTWIALSGTGLLVVAPASDDPPLPTSAAAFVIEPGDIVAIGKGVWMCHFFPIGRFATYNVITARREPEQDRDLVDFIETANTVLELALPQLHG